MTKSDFSGFWVEEERKGDAIVNIGNVWRKGLLLGILLLLALVGSAQAEGFQVRVEKDIIGFDENQITVETDQTGLLTLTLSDNYGTYRTITREAKRGTTTFMWDGLGENEERLPSGSYTLHALLVTARGNQETQINVTVGKAKQALLFALRSSDTLYLDTDDWFCEAKPVRTGAVVMDIYAADDLNTKLDTLKKTFGSTTKVSWNGRVKGKKVAEGDYLLRFYAESNPAYVRDVRVTVKEGARPVIPVAETGSIMPTWDMDDAAMWDMMMKPSVVVDIAAVSHQKVYDKPSTNGKALGTLHGQSQGIEVMKVEGGWAYIGAWQHESGGYIEGWVPMKRLKTVTPNSDFGLLVDKQTQRMKVFYRGKCITTLTISTGLAGKNRLIRETAAGAFITVERVSDFEDSGYHYEYAIRYDGGNLIHQLGYKAQRTKKDFSDQEPVLGQKGSHGCVRIPRAVDATGVNVYYLWTHLPYGTRLFILDDPENRTLQAAAVSDKVQADVTAPTDVPALSADETELVLTLGGDAVLGTREYWWNDPESLPAYLNQYGMAYPFSGLQSLFASDDMTFINLECALKEDGKGEQTGRLWRFRGLPSYTEALWQGSIEQVNIANNHHGDYGTAGEESTRQALIDAGMPFSGYGYTYVWEKNGHKIGFAGCRETTYKNDEFVIARDINRLREQGCDVIVYSCHWGTEYDDKHNALQQEMAYRAVAAGADIVVGNHPHVVQGLTSVGGAVVFYSFGNLMFGGTHDLTTFDAMVAQVRLRFRGKAYVGCEVDVIPILTSGRSAEGVNDFRPVLAEGEDWVRIWEKVQKDTLFTMEEKMYFAK